MESSVLVLLIGSTSAIIGLALRLCYLSKCVSVKLCNCLEIKRDTQGEQQININGSNASLPRSNGNAI